MLTRRSFLAASSSMLLPTACTPVEGRVVPAATLDPIQGLRTRGGWPLPPIEASTFRNGVTVLNVWASWCIFCKSEHDVLVNLSHDLRIKLVGIADRDKADNVRTYLMEAGNPYKALSLDPNGLVLGSIGLWGVPHTFVIDHRGQIVASLPGALSDETVSGKLELAIRKAHQTS